MKKLYYAICSKYRKLRNPKISYVFKMNMKEYLKKKNQLRY